MNKNRINTPTISTTLTTKSHALTKIAIWGAYFLLVCVAALFLEPLDEGLMIHIL